ncbi:hypothetical protein LUZ60_009263 [Juncus effusus]|nr:hypothetical protein LUZ60_009263 [Juncus effusus]
MIRPNKEKGQVSSKIGQNRAQIRLLLIKSPLICGLHQIHISLSLSLSLSHIKLGFATAHIILGLIRNYNWCQSISMGCLFSKEKYDDEDEEKIDFKGGNVHVISSKEHWDQKTAEADKNGKIVVANFSASWCGPCRVIAPVYADLSEKYPNLMFLTIDVDELVDFSSSWDIRATPTFFFMKDGKQLDKLVGANKPELEKKLASIAEESA